MQICAILTGFKYYEMVFKVFHIHQSLKLAGKWLGFCSFRIFLKKKSRKKNRSREKLHPYKSNVTKRQLTNLFEHTYVWLWFSVTTPNTHKHNFTTRLVSDVSVSLCVLFLAIVWVSSAYVFNIYFSWLPYLMLLIEENVQSNFYVYEYKPKVKLCSLISGKIKIFLQPKPKLRNIWALCANIEYYFLAILLNKIPWRQL